MAGEDMNELTARQKFILNAILDKGPLNIKDLSRQIHVSNRTISREITAINIILKHDGITIKENNSNLNVNGKIEKLNNLKHSLGGIPMQWLVSQEQRMLLITAQLLLSEEPIKSAYFSYQLNVVDGTISLYVDKIQQWLGVRYLNLEKKRGYGLIVMGSEWVKRNTFLELLYEYKPIDELLAYIYEDKQDPAIHVFFNMFFHKELINISKGILELVSSDMVKMDDMAYFSSLIHIMLSLKKAKLGSSINLPDYLIHDVLSSNEFSFINKIKDYLISLNIDIPHSELVYIAIQLLGNKYVYKADGKFTELGVSLEELSKEVLYEVEKKLNIKINCDDQLIIGLSQHFNPALYRIKMGIQVKNPLVEEIKKYYGSLFNVVNHACRLVFSKYNITMPEDEIGFITMHVGAAIERTRSLTNKLSALIICPNGMGTAGILLSKVKSAIPSIDRIAIKSFKDWSNSDDEYDIVLSTVNIDGEKGSNDNIIIVSPFLQQNDIDRINNYIKQHKGDVGSFNKITSFYKAEINNDSEVEKYEMINNMLKNLQLKIIDTNSFNEMITLIAESIYNENIINNKEEVEKLILNREKAGSVVIPNSSVALLHTRSNSAISPFVGVYRLKDCMRLKSVGFADEDVNTFIVLLARKTESPYILEQMGKISISLIEKKDFTENLRLGDIKDIRSSIIKILNEEDI